jgi:hypothetical protein
VELCIVALCGSDSQTLRRNISHQSSGSESRGRKKQAEANGNDPTDGVTFLRHFGSFRITPSYIPEVRARHSHRFDAVLCYSWILTNPNTAGIAQSAWRRAGRSGFYSRRGKEIFLCSTVSKFVVGTTLPPVQWVPGAPSRRVKGPGRETDHSALSSADVMNSPTRLHDMVLNQLSAGSTLPLWF